MINDYFSAMRKTKHKSGFTLAEAMMAVVILGITSTAIILPFSSGAAVQAEGRYRTLAAKLASDLMEEIINTPFADIVSTYNGYAEAQGEVLDVGGVAFTDSNYAKFSRDANCVNVYTSQESQAADSQFIHTTVRVYYDGREITVINRLISK